jgi:hypothetical protein
MHQVPKILFCQTLHVSASSVPIIRSYRLYMWQLVCFMQVMWPLTRRVRLEQPDPPRQQPETCRGTWQNKILDTWCTLLVIYTKIITMHGHLNIKISVLLTEAKQLHKFIGKNVVDTKIQCTPLYRHTQKLFFMSYASSIYALPAVMHISGQYTTLCHTVNGINYCHM